MNTEIASAFCVAKIGGRCRQEEARVGQHALCTGKPGHPPGKMVSQAQMSTCFSSCFIIIFVCLFVCFLAIILVIIMMVVIIINFNILVYVSTLLPKPYLLLCF